MKVRVINLDIANNAKVSTEDISGTPVERILRYASYVIVGFADGSSVQYSHLHRSEQISGPGEWPEDP